MGIKRYIKNKIKNKLGIAQIQQDLQNAIRLQTSIALNTLDIPKEYKQSVVLSYFPTPRGIITLRDSTLIRAYLALVTPICSQSIKLSRIGGQNDGGYVMATPPR